jgi:hypothetical protein
MVLSGSQLLIKVYSATRETNFSTILRSKMQFQYFKIMKRIFGLVPVRRGYIKLVLCFIMNNTLKALHSKIPESLLCVDTMTKVYGAQMDSYSIC